MTDTFIPNNDKGNLDNLNNQNLEADKTAGLEEEVDTRNPEYQVSVMQKRLEDKDAFIEQLKQEAQSAREMYATLEERLGNMGTIEEVLKRGQQGVSNQTTNLDEDELVGKVIENLSKRDAEQRMQQNYLNAVETMKQTYGEAHVEAKVQEAAMANGLQVSDMVEMAKKSPTAFNRLVGIQNKPSSPQPTQSTFNNSNDLSNTKDAAYFARLLRENPREYWKPETQREFRKLFQEGTS